MEKRFEYRGDLAVTPLAEILATIHRYRVPGVVRASHDGCQRLIYLDNGLVVFAATTDREGSLGSYVLRHALLPPEVTHEAMRQVREGLRLGQVLVKMGALDEEGLKSAVSGQIREILWGAFDWDSGDVIFEIGERRSEEVIRIDIGIPEVILEGIRRARDVRRFVLRLGQAGTILDRTPGLLLNIFPPAERDYYDRIDGRTSLKELCRLGPGAASDNARVLYAFFCLGLLRKTALAPVGKKIRYNTGAGSMGE